MQRGVYNLFLSDLFFQALRPCPPRSTFPINGTLSPSSSPPSTLQSENSLANFGNPNILTHVHMQFHVHGAHTSDMVDTCGPTSGRQRQSLATAKVFSNMARTRFGTPSTLNLGSWRAEDEVPAHPTEAPAQSWAPSGLHPGSFFFKQRRAVNFAHFGFRAQSFGILPCDWLAWDGGGEPRVSERWRVGEMESRRARGRRARDVGRRSA